MQSFDLFSVFMKQEYPHLTDQMIKDEYTNYSQQQVLFKHISKLVPNAITCNDIIAEVRLQLGKSQIHGINRALNTIDNSINIMQDMLIENPGNTEVIAAGIAGALTVKHDISILRDMDIRENLFQDTSNDNGAM